MRKQVGRRSFQNGSNYKRCSKAFTFEGFSAFFVCCRHHSMSGNHLARGKLMAGKLLAMRLPAEQTSGWSNCLFMHDYPVKWDFLNSGCFQNKWHLCFSIIIPLKWKKKKRFLHANSYQMFIPLWILTPRRKTCYDHCGARWPSRCHCLGSVVQWSVFSPVTTI